MDAKAPGVPRTCVAWNHGAVAAINQRFHEIIGQHSGNPDAAEIVNRNQEMLRAIRASNWKLGGPHGAAARLGMKRTTLAYRIHKLNIPLRPQ